MTLLSKKTLAKLSEELKSDLLKEIVAKGHKCKGHLLRSIKVTHNESGTDFNIEIEAHDYILYLDEGKFVENFLVKAKKKIGEQIGLEVAQEIRSQLMAKIKL